MNLSSRDAAHDRVLGQLQNASPIPKGQDSMIATPVLGSGTQMKPGTTRFALPDAGGTRR